VTPLEAATARVPEPRLTAPPPKLAPAPPPPPVVTPPRLGPAMDAPEPVAAPTVVMVPKRRSGFGYAIAWALGIGIGAVAAGAFVGFLVNGPPGRALPSRTIADVMPPTPEPPPPPKIDTASAQPPAATPAPAAADAAQPDTAKTGPTDATRTRLPPIPQAPEPPLNSGEIREVQARLRTLGFNAGPIDGTIGPQTTAGVKAYQQARGLTADGTPDKELLTKLRQEQPSQQHQTQAAPPPPPRRAYQPPPPPRRQQQDPLMESIERLFRR
jgi:hypothetical protein